MIKCAINATTLMIGTTGEPPLRAIELPAIKGAITTATSQTTHQSEELPGGF